MQYLLAKPKQTVRQNWRPLVQHAY